MAFIDFYVIVKLVCVTLTRYNTKMDDIVMNLDTSSYLKPIHPAISANLILIGITSFIVLILKIFNAILEPMNYEIVSNMERNNSRVSFYNNDDDINSYNHLNS